MEERQMSGHEADSAPRLMGLMFRAHPWHGVSIGDEAPEVVTAYIEIVPTDTVKYEVDKVSRAAADGDGDPVDVCVLTERPINHGGILVSARPIGGLRMFDGREADDKIVAVLEGDAAFGEMSDVAECPPAVVERLRHYFLTYKDMPGTSERRAEITHVYGAEEARRIIQLRSRTIEPASRISWTSTPPALAEGLDGRRPISRRSRRRPR
jgi:inorganic pyrophosphatase